MTSTRTRALLVKALSDVVPPGQRQEVRHFLSALSADELQYVADFLGCCTLEADHPFLWPRLRLIEAIERFDRLRGEGGYRQKRVADREHKMVVLFEFLRRCTKEAALTAGGGTPSQITPS